MPKKDAIEDLIREGDDLEMPPRSTDERRAFARWLRSALDVAQISLAQLADESGVSREDVRAMVENESLDTSKRDREIVCDFLLETLSRIGDIGGAARPSDPTDRLKRVLSGTIGSRKDCGQCRRSISSKSLAQARPRRHLAQFALPPRAAKARDGFDARTRARSTA